MAANQSDIKDWVQKYLDLGWSPIPIPKGEKGPRISGWENLDFKVEDFDDDANIGVHLGRTLYDVDYDHPYAARAAEGLMPDTPATFGRPSKLRSHGFYIVTDEPITSLQFKDTNETMLVELRGLTQDGQPTQTVVPCSVHKSGERISWAGDYRQALRLPKAALVRGVTLDAIAAILAVHFPEPKARHKPRLALASYLSRLGLTDTEVKYVGLSIMRVIPEGDRQAPR
jgi:hypothetical protein